ncbi:MAG: FAD-dependent oxidoreductase [Smithellaceae bacterium]
MVNQFSSLFSPISIGQLTLKNRLVYPAVGGIVPKADMAKYLALRAKGGVGLIIIGGSLLQRDVPAEVIQIYTDDCIPMLKEIAREAHKYGAKIGAQVEHQGQQTDFPDDCVGPSPIPWSPNSRVPRELTVGEIHNLVEEFSDGIRRIRDAGLDIAEIHGAHGYMGTQFLSPRSNQRKDEYGGNLTNRARFLVEIIRRAREKVGDSFPICCRINASDYIEGGVTVEDTKFIAPLLEEAGASLISLSAGVYGYPVTIPCLYSPPGLNVEFAGQIKETLRIPVCVAGRIHNAQLAEQILREGKADLIAMARPLLVDPELPNKVMRGEEKRVRPCISCNNGCMATMEFRTLISRCTVNPWLATEELKEHPPAKSVKKVVIIGGGLAGLEAARVAASRGHKVTVYEKAERLGGQWIVAAVPPSKETFVPYLEWLINEVKLAGVEIKLNTSFSLNDHKKDNPDTVILATGGLPVRLPLPGIENTTTAWDVLQSKTKPGNNVLIVGGNATGLEVAHLLAVQGKNVTVIEMTSRFGADMPPTARWHLRKLLTKHDVKLMSNVKLKQIKSNKEVIADTKEGEKTLAGYSDVIMATGVCPCNELKSSLEPVVRELYIIGDAKQPRSGLEAIAEGAQVGLLI